MKPVETLPGIRPWPYSATIRSSAWRWRSISRKSSSRVSRGIPGASMHGSVGKELLERVPDALARWVVGVLELRREGDRRVGRRQERRRRVEQFEALAGDEREDLPGDALRPRGLLDDEQARG